MLDTGDDLAYFDAYINPVTCTPAETCGPTLDRDSVCIHLVIRRLKRLQKKSRQRVQK
jgi:hypothetical protein